jgi:hypothetical protein
MEMYLSEMETPPAARADEAAAETDGTDEAAAETDGTDEAAAGSDGAELNGTLHYKYIPRTGVWDEADAEYAVMTPSATPDRRVTAQCTGRGSVRFHRAEWQDLPTQYHIVNAFADLEQIDFLGASIVETIGGKDLSDQRILR